MRFLEQMRLGVAGFVSVLAVGLSIVSPAAGLPPDRGNLIVSGSASPNPGAAGGQVTYAVSIKNDSIVTATGVLVTIQMPQDSPAPQFVKCSVSGGAKGQTCAESGGLVMTTYPTIKAHVTAKVSVTWKMPGASGTFTVGATAHAAGAIGGEEPRDGSSSVAGTVLSDSVPVVFQPSQRTGTLSCGANITPGFFDSGEHTVQLRASMGCAHSKIGVKISSSGKTLDFQGFKIVGAATDQIKGSVGVLVAAPNVTVVGGGTASKSGIEYFDYCLMDEGDSDGLTVSSLRCFRARSAGVDIASDGVKLNGLLVDLVVGGPNTTTEIPGGIGMHLSGGVSVKDSTVRRASIGILADGAPDPDGTKHRVQIDGNYSTSRVEQITGVGIQLEGAFHEVRNTYVEGDGDDGVSTTGVLINGSAILTDGLQVVDFGGNGFLVNGAQATVKRSTVEAVGSDSFVVAGAGAVLTGNSAAKGLKGFVVSGPDAFLDTNNVENVLGTAFLVSGDRAIMTGNSAKAGKAEGFVLEGHGGNYNTNKAEANIGAAFAVKGNNGLFVNNACKSEKTGAGFLVTGTSNSFSTNSAEKNKGSEWVIAAGNVDLGSNRKNGKTFPFTTAGGTFE